MRPKGVGQAEERKEEETPRCVRECVNGLCVCFGPFRMQIQLKLPKSAVATLLDSILNPALALSRKAALCADLKHCGACLLIKYKLHSFIIGRR